MNGPPRATIVIVTKNRSQELRKAVESALRQSIPVEVLVIDDGSTDGTSDMVRGEFPGVKLHRVERSQGYIVQRNLAASLATTPFIISIDDDAVLASGRTVEQTLDDFHELRVGAVAIPFINVNESDAVLQRAPDDRGIYSHGFFWGTAHALRRDLFLKLGGYRQFLFHQGEEMDLCIRMLGEGYVPRLGRADPIHHFESPRRDFSRVFIFAVRNTILYGWYNVPARWLLIQWAGSVINQLRHGIRKRHPIWVMRGLVRGFGAALWQLGQRQPVSVRIYKTSRRLRKQGPLPLSAFEAELPPIAPL